MFAAYCLRVLRKAFGVPVVPEDVSIRNGASSAAASAWVEAREGVRARSSSPTTSPDHPAECRAARIVGTSVMTAAAPVVTISCIWSATGQCASTTVRMRAPASTATTARAVSNAVDRQMATTGGSGG